jgi:hypothetical protein
MNRTLAIMFTMTTYGTWLRGDQRGWVDDGRVYPPDPILEAADARRMLDPTFLVPKDRLMEAGSYIGAALIDKLQLRVWALTVRTWHTHFVIGATHHDVADIAKAVKDKVRRGLKERRPIWTDGYDKRFCFDEAAVWSRIRYVERHNLELGVPAQPWPFLTYPI